MKHVMCARVAGLHVARQRGRHLLLVVGAGGPGLHRGVHVSERSLHLGPRQG